jgi:hypothetical protein
VLDTFIAFNFFDFFDFAVKISTTFDLTNYQFFRQPGEKSLGGGARHAFYG